MPAVVQLVLSPREAADERVYLPLAARKLGIREDRIALARIIHRSVDARSRNIKVNLGLEVFVDSEGKPAEIHFEYSDVTGRPSVIVVGAGPAGLFAALRLIELGFRPIVLERGKDVSARKKDVARINRNGPVDPDSNYAFGEGGAGAFSDGKLFTRSKKRGDFRKILEVLHYHGAQEEILYDAHPHIGTDRLPRVISALRERVLSCGGQIFHSARVEDIFVKGGKVTGIAYNEGQRIEACAVILAAGHSARDIYELLVRKNIMLEPKAFAMGLRVEHPQAVIDRIQYHLPERGEYLPAAAYSLVSQVGGRGVYSFCMCPGGFIVPAKTAADEAVVNGMSPSERHSRFADSGIVTEVRLEDFAHLAPQYGVLAGLQFQRELEQAAFARGGGRQIVPGQRLTDFISGKASRDLPAMSYHPGAVPTAFGQWLPEFLGKSLREGLTSFGEKMRGFVTGEAVLLGVESRTSSPVRIPRDSATLMHPQVEGLFPSAEGAGYAGGIVSAAMDGERCAEAAQRYMSEQAL
ncbi:MAG: FAD-binding protein [Rikenellaceae bacterium]|jgi:uncharacterized FAD-dependent dehydrogenase|nr:FAD-binding protein [Rikenellaceae bacterium]